jgi:hypothetical protein
MPENLRHTRFAFGGALAVFALALLSVSNVLAQQATPAVAITPGVVPAAECTTAPIPLDLLGKLVTTPVPAAPYVPPNAVPAGTAPDAQTATEVTAAVRQFIACTNSGDALRALALLDPTYLRLAIDPTGRLDQATADKLAESLATPTFLRQDQLISLIAIRQMIQAPDGTVATVVETDGGPNNPPGTDVDLLIWEKVDGAWLIKDAVKNIDDIIAAQTPTPSS